MMEKYDRKIILEDGAEYYGYGFGDTTDKVCEIVFNTSMVGYLNTVHVLVKKDLVPVISRIIRHIIEAYDYDQERNGFDLSGVQ